MISLLIELIFKRKDNYNIIYKSQVVRDSNFLFTKFY